jgi:hypothetical protein
MKACYICFLEPYYFDYTYEYILRCFTYVLNENVFSKKMIYEKRLSFGRINVICENDNII